MWLYLKEFGENVAAKFLRLQ